MYRGYVLANKYQFEYLLGAGGMGEVWSCTRLILGDSVAIKVLKINQSDRRERLKKEAETTSIINHPNICKIYDFVEQDNNCFLVMEKLEGVDLQKVISCSKQLKGIDQLSLGLYVAKEVLRALEKAHNLAGDNTHAILHKDIKPANIFLTKNGEVKLLDLGVAEVESKSSDRKSSFFTKQYSSPEFWQAGQYNDQNYSMTNDIYGLGLVFYEVITGKKAFSGRAEELYANIERGVIPSIEKLSHSNEVAQIFLKWTHKNPSQRFRSAKELLVIISDIVLDYQINENLIQKTVDQVKSFSDFGSENTEKVETKNTEDLMKLKKTGTLDESSGKRAEEEVLSVIEEVFGKDYARIFVNKTIPHKNKTPDFVIPLIDKDGRFKFAIVECKASHFIYNDGKTKFSDPFSQITTYRDRLAHSLKLMNRQCDFLCLVVLPNLQDIPKNLKHDGRDGVFWMDLKSFKNKMMDFKPISSKHKEYELVQMIYANKEVIQSYREKVCFSQEQEKILNWNFGGTKRIKGLAGTGKSLVLAKKLVSDIIETDPGDFLYLTHNNNLLLKFQEYVCGFLDDEDVKILSTTKERSAFIYHCEYQNKKFSITFCTLDAFSTSCVTSKMDKLLYDANSHGPLFTKSKELRGNSPTESSYKAEREGLISLLTPFKFNRKKVFEKYKGIYVDEFQDCRIDSSRLLLPLLFTETNEQGEPNLCFTEDTLQSFVKYSVLQEIDDSFDDVKKGSLATNQQLGLPKMYGRSIELHTIYRTPERIFKITMNILKNQGGLLKDKVNYLDKLSYKNFNGEVFFINEPDVHLQLDFMLDERQRFPHEVIFIESLEHRLKSDLYQRVEKQFGCHDVVNGQIPREDTINFYHEFNVRGLEAKAVFLIVDENLVGKPNYIYTLICRTKIDLILVKSNSLSEQKFKDFVSFMSDRVLKQVS